MSESGLMLEYLTDMFGNNSARASYVALAAVSVAAGGYIVFNAVRGRINRIKKEEGEILRIERERRKISAARKHFLSPDKFMPDGTPISESRCYLR